MALKKILAVGLNPTWQKALSFENLRFYQVNRARNVKAGPSGKGINFVRAVDTWGKAGAVVYQFAGGETGEKISSLLKAEGVRNVTQKVKAPTRVCTTCLCEKSGEMTELIEPSGKISASEAASLRRKILADLPGASGLAVCGTFPPGVTPGFYASLAKAALKEGVPVLLDAWKDVGRTLDAGVEILKINLEELRMLTGKDELRQAIKKCAREHRVKIIAVTDGPNKAFLFDGSRLCSYAIPKNLKVLSPLGAGDTVSGVFFSEFVTGTGPVEAFANGLAAASASCMTLDPASYSTREALSIRRRISIEKENLQS